MSDEQGPGTGNKTIGIATDVEQKRLGLWKTYRVTISRVNPELAPDIDWPSQPE